jgi:hypothetical protein
MSISGADAHATPIRWPTRIWFVVEVFFGLAAISSIFLSPDKTQTNFAWPIKPVVMAAVLGAFYLSTAALFLLPLVLRRWEDVRVVVIPSAIFTAIMLLATFLHWDKFSVGTLPFYVWFASYVLPPPILAALFWWQQRAASPIGADVVQPLPRWFRRLCLINGAAFVIIASVLFLFPQGVLAQGPWAFTPLTIRTLSGWLIATGLLLVFIAWENDWRRVRIGTAMLIILGPALLFQLVRYSAQVSWGNAWLLIALVDFLALTLIMLGMWVRRLRPQPAALPSLRS